MIGELFHTALTQSCFFFKAQLFLGLYYADDSNKHYDMKKSFYWLKMASGQNVSFFWFLLD